MADETKADLTGLEIPAPAEAVDTAGEADGKVTPMVRSAVAEQHSRLRDAMRRARLNEAERRDVIVSLREGEVARLELLQDALADVFDAVPAESDLFDGAILPGNPPRLWVDVLAYVTMGRDRRTYQFVQETRYGRRTILETTSVEDMGKRVTDYVAHRLMERERALASDELALIGRADREPGPADDQDAAAPRPEEVRFASVNAAEAGGSLANRAGVSDSGSGRRMAMVVMFLLGMAVGAAALFAYGLYRIPA